MSVCKRAEYLHNTPGVSLKTGVSPRSVLPGFWIWPYIWIIVFDMVLRRIQGFSGVCGIVVYIDPINTLYGLKQPHAWGELVCRYNGFLFILRVKLANCLLFSTVLLNIIKVIGQISLAFMYVCACIQAHPISCKPHEQGDTEGLRISNN
jgi:hypothetical protein